MWRTGLLRRWSISRGLKLGAQAIFLAAALFGVANGALQLGANVAPAATLAEDRTMPGAGSPFAPWAGVEAAPAHADALIGAIRAAGVRVAADPARSGAVLTMHDQRQRAFGVGDEIGFGARLAAVRADHVLIERNGRLLRLELGGWPDRT